MALSISSLVKARFIISGTSPGGTGFAGVEGVVEVVAEGFGVATVRAPACGEEAAGDWESDPRSTPFRQAASPAARGALRTRFAAILIRLFEFIAWSLLRRVGTV
jgi:hypothetical protein